MTKEKIGPIEEGILRQIKKEQQQARRIEEGRTPLGDLLWLEGLTRKDVEEQPTSGCIDEAYRTVLYLSPRRRTRR